MGESRRSESPPDPGAGGPRALSLARRWLQDLWRRWDEASRFSRARVGIIVGYAGVCLLLLVVVLVGGEAAGPLRAAAWYQILDEEFHVRVENRDDEAWQGVTLTLNGRYAATLESLAAASSETLELTAFREPGCTEPKVKARKGRRGKKYRTKSRKKRRSRRRRLLGRLSPVRPQCAPPRGEAPKTLQVVWKDGEASWDFPPLAGPPAGGEKP